MLTQKKVVLCFYQQLPHLFLIFLNFYYKLYDQRVDTTNLVLESTPGCHQAKQTIIKKKFKFILS